MKNVYLIGGPMGVGKTAVSMELKKRLDNAVFLDGDWCWDADPFIVTEETKNMVLDNIKYVLNNFIKCSQYENVIFAWVMNTQEIVDSVVSGLNLNSCRLHTISLICSEETLVERLLSDIHSGKRENGIIEKSLAYLPMYKSLNTVKIDTTGKSVYEIGDFIEKL